jgi:GNAT superfamily N-acetyltransferase
MPSRNEGEEIERAALASLHAAASPALAAALGLRIRMIRDATVSAAAALPASAIVINRAIGLGTREPVTAGAVAAIADAYRTAEVARYFLHLHPDAASDAAVAACRAAGLAPARSWRKFVREAGTALPETEPIEIREVDAATAPAFARIVCAAFDLGESAEAWIAALAHHPAWHLFLAVIDGEPAGTGGLFVQGSVGWTDWGATAPPFRERGVQRALLAHRLRLADTRGLARVHTCTGEAVPGDPQHSYRNILRCGFTEGALRGNWAKPGS